MVRDAAFPLALVHLEYSLSLFSPPYVHLLVLKTAHQGLSCQVEVFPAVSQGSCSLKLYLSYVCQPTISLPSTFLNSHQS